MEDGRASRPPISNLTKQTCSAAALLAAAAQTHPIWIGPMLLFQKRGQRVDEDGRGKGDSTSVGGGQGACPRLARATAEHSLAASMRTTRASRPPWRCRRSRPATAAPGRCPGPRSSSRGSRPRSLRSSTARGAPPREQDSARVRAWAQQRRGRWPGSVVRRFCEGRPPTRQCPPPAST